MENPYLQVVQQVRLASREQIAGQRLYGEEAIFRVIVGEKQFRRLCHNANTRKYFNTDFTSTHNDMNMN